MSVIKPLKILLIEDDPGDIELIKVALEDSKLGPKLFVVEDGQQAIDFLQKKGPYSDAAVPDLILLDLNLPKKDGRQVLKEIKLDEKLKAIPVVILTTSKAERDILECYRLGANCCITKPVGLDKFLSLVRCLEEFWFTIVKLPTRTKEQV